MTLEERIKLVIGLPDTDMPEVGGCMMTSIVSGLSASQIAALPTSTVAKFTPTDIAALTTTQTSALSSPQLNVLSAADIQAFSAPQISALTANALIGLAVTQVANFSSAQIRDLSQSQTQSLTASQINGLGTTDLDALNMANLSTTQIKGLTAAAVGNLGTNGVKSLSAGQLSAISTAAIAGLTANQIGVLSTSQVDALSAGQIGALSNAQLNDMSANQLGALTAAQAQALTTTQLNGLSQSSVNELKAASLTATQINGLSKTNLDALNVSGLASSQVAGLTATTIGNLTAAQFTAAIAPNIASVSTSAVKGLTTAELDSLTTTQSGTISAAQLAAMSSTQNDTVVMAGQVTNGSLSYNGMLDILQREATGGMTATKFGALQDIASMLDAPGGISTSAYVQQIADDVIDGNSANAAWNGGSSTAVGLGNLSATSSQTSVDELIGKWFLGTDLPGTNMSGVGIGNYNPTYVPTTLPLFGTSGTPSYQDVNQGQDGDCYLVSALAETALKDPSQIKSMIQSNGNGTYSVDFNVNGKADYVTVNSELPTMTSYEQANGSKLEFANGSVAWVGLIEKAYAELNEQTNVPHGAELNTAGDSYEDISGGGAYTLTQITGQAVDTYGLNSSMSSGALNSIESTVAAAFNSGEEVMMSTPSTSTGNLVASHMFEVTGINAAAKTVTLQNPWNTAYGASGLAMSFTETIAQLAAAGCSLYATTGAPTA